MDDEHRPVYAVAADVIGIVQACYNY
ncbi:hypothetical protein ACWCPQ_11815 [Nocardia sp. NPDC001965]